MIPTIRFQILKYSRGNYVRLFWLFALWGVGWCSKRPGDCGQCRGTTTEHRSSPRAPHQPKLARNSDTRSFCSTRKRCNSAGAISTFDIHAGKLRATFLRNHNMRRHKDPSGRQPRQKTPQAQQTEDNPSPEDNSSSEDPRNPDNRHKHGGTAPVTWHCTRYVAVHSLRGGTPEQKRCIAYGSGAAPQQTRTNAELAHRTTHRHTPPCAAGPYWWQDGHAAHATTCTPAHSDTSYTLTYEEPGKTRNERGPGDVARSAPHGRVRARVRPAGAGPTGRRSARTRPR